MGRDDDDLVGRILSRREVLVLMGATGVVLLPGCSGDDTPTVSAPTSARNGESATTRPGASPGTGTEVGVPNCIVKPELTEGPFFVDAGLDRADIRTDPATGVAQAGTALALSFRCARLSGGACTALAGATVDVWHCDAAGRYSGVAQDGTAGQQFLRGFQTTDANGRATFTTIYPGWYPGRAVHVHFKIRSGNQDFASQLFFPDSLNTTVFGRAPYASHGPSPTDNARDGIYGRAGGQLLLAPVQQGQGYTAAFEIALQV